VLLKKDFKREMLRAKIWRESEKLSSVFDYRAWAQSTIRLLSVALEASVGAWNYGAATRAQHVVVPVLG
jgi:hypothetical protein